MEKKTVMIDVEEVKAHKIDNFQIYYQCKHCYSKYKKNGEPYKNAKKKIHIHGSGNDFSNRTESRIPHCSEDRRRASEVLIVIDDTTQKIDDPILRKRFLKQYP